MKYGPLIAVIFGFFLIAIYPYYADDEPTVFVVSDDDEDGVPTTRTSAQRKTQVEMMLMRMGVLMRK